MYFFFCFSCLFLCEKEWYWAIIIAFIDSCSKRKWNNGHQTCEIDSKLSKRRKGFYIVISHCEFWLRNDKSIIYFQILDIMCKHVRQTCKYLKNFFCTLSFFVNPSQVKWRPLNQTKTKNKRHFFIPTFKVIQLCFFVQNDSFTLKVLKTQFIFGWAMIRKIAD